MMKMLYMLLASEFDKSLPTHVLIEVLHFLTNHDSAFFAQHSPCFAIVREVFAMLDSKSPQFSQSVFNKCLPEISKLESTSLFTKDDDIPAFTSIAIVLVLSDEAHTVHFVQQMTDKMISLGQDSELVPRLLQIMSVLLRVQIAPGKVNDHVQASVTSFLDTVAAKGISNESNVKSLEDLMNDWDMLKRNGSTEAVAEELPQTEQQEVPATV